MVSLIVPARRLQPMLDSPMVAQRVDRSGASIPTVQIDAAKTPFAFESIEQTVGDASTTQYCDMFVRTRNFRGRRLHVSLIASSRDSDSAGRDPGMKCW